MGAFLPPELPAAFVNAVAVAVVVVEVAWAEAAVFTFLRGLAEEVGSTVEPDVTAVDCASPAGIDAISGCFRFSECFFLINISQKSDIKLQQASLKQKLSNSFSLHNFSHKF